MRYNKILPNKIKIYILLVLFSILLSVPTYAQLSGFFVDPIGNDGNNGASVNTPFATLEKCKSAMEASSTKTCYIRAGTYMLSGTIKLNRTDNGEKWSYYPPDGYNLAILDGGSTFGVSGSASGTGLSHIFSIDTASSITFDGLQMQHFQLAGITINSSGSITIVNNIIHDQTGAHYNEAAISINASPGSLVSHNYIYNVAYDGIGYFDSEGGYENATVSNNVIINSCTFPAKNSTFQDGGDCGAMYIETPSYSNGWNANVTNNYIRDIGVNSNGFGDWSNCCDAGVYTDNGGSNVKITGNVFTGVQSACVNVHEGSNVTVSQNICDVDNSGPQVFYSASHNHITTNPMLGNTFTNNIVVNEIGNAGNGTSGDLPDPYQNNKTIIMNNAYFNFVGKSLKTGGSVGDDSNPVYENPLFLSNDWTYTLAPESPVLNAPVNFQQPAGWGQPGFWGPPGFVIPQGGTKPSYLIPINFLNAILSLNRTLFLYQ